MAAVKAKAKASTKVDPRLWRSEDAMASRAMAGYFGEAGIRQGG
jgi:hypothetical protein